MYNQITLLGNVGSDAEQRYTPGGVAVSNFSLAVGKKIKGDDKTIWFRVSLWNKLAETLSQYLVKGQQVLVIGELEEPRTYTDRSGETRVSLEVTAREIRLVGRRGDHDSGGGAKTAAPADEVSDEDIPF